MGDRGVDHQVVGLPAEDRAGRPCRARAGDDPVQVEVDEALAAGGLVDGGGAEAGELVVDAHSSRHHLGEHALEGLGVADVLVAGRAAGVVGALLGALVVVGLEVLLRLHRLHRLALGLDHRRDVDERRRHEVAQLGLVGLEQEERGRRDRLERAGHAGAGGGRAGARDDLVGDRVVGVEGVRVGVGDQHVGRELADRVDDLR